MRAALYAAERGHDVTLYEQSDRLGGQLKLMDAPSFKWPLANYRDYLITQLAKSKVRVLLNTPATPEILHPENYDVLIAALGATPKLPPISGAERCKNIFQVFGHEQELGKRCVVIGGSESGTEAGMYLAENGHDTVVLTRQSGLALDATPIHYRETMQEFYGELPNFHFIANATATEVGEGYVAYRDADGNIQKLECDSVVALGGMQAHQQEAMALYACAKDFYMIGDCRSVGNLHTGSRDAYSVTHQF
jgi:NADPH-dependent 2,4-dienoyl-CoA reductase/sulfur reductase-like enzyme